MQKNISQWLLGLVLVVYPILCTGTALIAGLGRYCGRGSVYISELRTFIHANNLE